MTPKKQKKIVASIGILMVMLVGMYASRLMFENMVIHENYQILVCAVFMGIGTVGLTSIWNK